MIINVNYPHSCFCYSQCSLLTVFTCSSSFWFPQELYHGESPFHLYLVQRCCGNTKHAFCNTGYVLCMLFLLVFYDVLLKYFEFGTFTGYNMDNWHFQQPFYSFKVFKEPIIEHSNHTTRKQDVFFWDPPIAYCFLLVGCYCVTPGQLFGFLDLCIHNKYNQFRSKTDFKKTINAGCRNSQFS